MGPWFHHFARRIQHKTVLERKFRRARRASLADWGKRVQLQITLQRNAPKNHSHLQNVPNTTKFGGNEVQLKTKPLSHPGVHGFPLISSSWKTTMQIVQKHSKLNKVFLPDIQRKFAARIFVIFLEFFVSLAFQNTQELYDPFIRTWVTVWQSSRFFGKNKVFLWKSDGIPVAKMVSFRWKNTKNTQLPETRL